MVEKKFDVVIVGAEFGGVYHLYHLRKLGYNVHVVDAQAP
jgi:monoamine oxidase